MAADAAAAPSPDTAHFIGVRHHSPACARLVARAIATLRPAYVLVEGPADMNGRLDELLLEHRLPVAVFSHYRDEARVATSWAPLCDYSPEWIALRDGRAAGAEVRFIDLPAWHPAFTARAGGAANRYADAEARYAEATARLCERFSVDSVDALWDGLFEVTEDTEDIEGLQERLDAYFDLVRGDTEADAGDRAREAYMASWVRAAVARRGGRPVLVVTGGFHRPALRTLAAEGTTDWPEVPEPPEGALGGSFLVPYSFRQLDAFGGYQSGMPSPGYYQRLWESGAEAAAGELTRAVAERLRGRGVPVSTAALVAARALAQGLALMRGHPYETRVDVLDGLAGALITDDLDRPLPWTTRGTLHAGTHPVVAEMVAACTGTAEGRLHPGTPLPPLVHDVTERLARLGLADAEDPVRLDLTDPGGLERSRVLHRLRVLGIPGFTRVSGPADGADPVFTERWEPSPSAGREAALIEAGAYGARLEEAASVLLAERARTAGTDAGPLAGLLFDAVLCGVGPLSADLLDTLADQVGQVRELGPLGEVLATALGLWRHDRVFGVARGPVLGAVVAGAVRRALWLAEGLHGSGGGVDLGRLRALTAVRDALLYAPEAVPIAREAAAEAAARIAGDPGAPQDLRGAACGLGWALGGTADPAATVRALAPDALGDWLAGLFAVAREEVGRGEGPLVDVLDDIVAAMPEDTFFAALPALRQAFAFFPPREREAVAAHLLERRGRAGSARSLLRTTADPLRLARAKALEATVTDLLTRHGLRTPRPDEHTTGPRTPRPDEHTTGPRAGR
ncbi:hypothetical protein Stsp02_03780 [Streptomyces sp. NBRC 14336]|uniref:DUF5682 family protein n=1 Tax=Streptomyces sp. NBRC 14336 TaxID=3030992 RepID=UPI0024A14703|nr:DUF5682 family protein [Streptomyces sp. NBRC 14336]GLW44716.1 hypothetical protein Stsp02_03780 [Streptomyces sp. NBRC 14336]